jgi:hypothetical protein
MPRSSYQEGASRRPAWIRRAWRRLGPAAASSVAFLVISAAPAFAAGPLYAVPDHPPSETESVGFTNALNDRVRHLPAPLDPPTAQSPAEVEARLQALERGVVIARGRPGGPASKRSEGQGRDHSAPTSKAADVIVTADGPDDRAPLSMAFVAAGALALIGLLLVARGKHHRSPQQA